MLTRLNNQGRSDALVPNFSCKEHISFGRTTGAISKPTKYIISDPIFFEFN